MSKIHEIYRDYSHPHRTIAFDRFFVVCDDCGERAMTGASETQPATWTTYLIGRLQRDRCAACTAVAHN